MAKTVPIYRNHEEIYQADACQPLVEAAARQEVRLEALARGHYPGRKFPQTALPGVKTVGYWNADKNQHWGLPWHHNEGVEFMFLECGRVGFAVDDRVPLVLQADDLTVTRPWQRHSVGNPNVGAGRLHWLIVDVGVRRPNQAWKWPPWLMLSDPDRAELTDILRHTERPVWNASPEIRRCFQAVAHAVETDRHGSSISCLTVRLNDLFLSVLEMFRRQRVPLDHTLSSARRTVQLFLADLRAHPEHLALEWRVGDMARSCGLGVTQFVHHVRSLTNATPMRYLSDCRLEQAAKMLKDDRTLGVTDVAMNCGFSSAQYFATVFVHRYGRSPRDFRSAPALV